METYHNLLTVFLENQLVNGPIGWYEEERKKGVDLWISVYVSLVSVATEDHLEHSLDYTSLLKIVIEESSKETKLLETVAKRILENVQNLKPTEIETVEIVIRKKKLPVAGFSGDAVGIKLNWKK